MLPKDRSSKENVLSQMKTMRERDVKWREGKVFSLVFAADDELTALQKEAYTLFMSENGLNPTAFPSLRQFETEVITMSARLLGGDDEVVGNMTSGGTESLLMTVLTAREWGRARGITSPEMILPITAHPAFEKAAHYFNLKPIHTPVRADFRADVSAIRNAITPRTVLIVGSAPSYPHGVIDPISDLAHIARDHEILFHVDACVGGFLLPFARRLGYPIPPFDFSVDGVTSISADLHKYGYAAKGASLVLYRHKKIRRHQLFAYLDWSGGIYASPTMVGTRPGGAIAAAWAVMNYLGEEGYLALTDQVMKTATQLRDGINAIDGLHIVSDPDMSVMAITSDRLNIYEVGDEMTLRGWHLDRQQFPPTLHLTVMPTHARIVDLFLSDLTAAATSARKPTLQKVGNTLILKLAEAAVKILPEDVVSKLTSRASSVLGGDSGLPQRSAAMYGMMGSLPNRGDLRELVLDLVEGFTERKRD
ncbi:MAG: aspartate aminotransferase family protein [Chloroflexi bacterium]|nr:aspartate aminotransferase family protein [Chloroflexota bacterium]